MKQVLTFILMLLTAWLPPVAAAQHNDLLSRTQLLLRGGGMTYIGDLNNQSAFGEVRAAGGAGLNVRLDNRWSIRVEGAYGNIVATHDWIEQRGLYFRSRLIEGALLAEFNFRPFGGGETDYRWTPYLFGGVAVFHFNPQSQYIDRQGDTSWVDLQPLGTEGQGTFDYPQRKPYQLTQVSLPFGLGVKLRLGKHVTMAAEYGFRRTWTDYLDDVSTTYVGAELLREQGADGVVAAAVADRSETPNAVGIKRGDDSLPDWYSFFNLSVGVNLDLLFGWMRSKKCRN